MFSSENLKYILEDNIDKVLLKSGRLSIRSLASVAYFQAQHLDTLFSSLFSRSASDVANSTGDNLKVVCKLEIEKTASEKPS